MKSKCKKSNPGMLKKIRKRPMWIKKPSWVLEKLTCMEEATFTRGGGGGASQTNFPFKVCC